MGIGQIHYSVNAQNRPLVHALLLKAEKEQDCYYCYLVRLHFHMTWLPDHFSSWFCSIFTTETTQLFVLMYVFHLHRDLLLFGVTLCDGSSLGFQRKRKVICWEMHNKVYKSFKPGDFNKCTILKEERQTLKQFLFAYLAHFSLLAHLMYCV
jgi:hypothetical protein